MSRPKTEPGYLPTATYRLQFNHTFTFDQAAGIVDYLDLLGISDVYASPFLMARPGSMHGYDVTDHTRLNPEIGDTDAFQRLSGKLKEHGMGLIADVVPNHMCISHPSNVWWWDVLENGPSSPYARFFDIDWNPPKPELVNKVLLPILGDQFGRVLENEEIRVVYRDEQFEIAYYDNPLPLAPHTWTMILEPALQKMRDRMDPGDEHVLELESIATALNHLPDKTETDDAKVRARQREKEIVKRRLSTLVESCPQALEAIQQSLAEINGRRGDPHSFDRLERLLENQAYRLSFWRVAMDEINYRRFFDINDLAAIRVEDPEVFAAVHALLFDLVREGHIRGLRIDHPDGLFEPEKYFRELQDAAGSSGRPFYIVAEKILTGSEPLRESWPIAGTTGYKFLNLLNGLFVDSTREKAFQQLYRRFTGWVLPFEDLVYYSKRLILQVAMSSELNVLARKLDRISEQHRWYRDFTLENLRDALREVLTTFPVYRTYLSGDKPEVDAEDRRQIQAAIREAKRRNPAISESVFDFIQSILFAEHPDGLDDAQRAARSLFAMRFQQLSAPVTAKGVEDTAFYRYYPLASLNEVGGGPEAFGVSVNAFHRWNQRRQELWPHAMSATSTHDTKRDEDVRTRLDVLSEMPADWYRAIRRWRDLNRRWRAMAGTVAAPSPSEEYLLYQTLIGTWPLDSMGPQEHSVYIERIQRYMEKALREAKLHTSWINPNAAYESVVRQFVAKVLEPSAENVFLEEFRQFQAPVARAGMWNSIAQVVLKIASPGVPDFYQGNELWSLRLVDPDNRGAVDFEARRRMLAQFCAGEECDRAPLLERLTANPCDGAIKLYITSRALRLRRGNKELFSHGAYLPLSAEGSRSRHVIAFARVGPDCAALAIAGRFFLRLCNSHPRPQAAVWQDTTIVLPKRMRGVSFHDVFSGRRVTIEEGDGQMVIPLQSAFEFCPAALLISE